MLAHRERRMGAPAGGAPVPRIDVPGQLMSTGAFVFPWEGSVRALSYPQLGQFSVAGDPRVVSAATSGLGRSTLHRSFAQFDNNSPEDAFPFFDGLFGDSLTVPLQSGLAGGYPVLGARVFRHFSDNLQALAATTDLSTAGGPISGYRVFIDLNGNQQQFQLEGVNAGDGIDGDPGLLLDTYWGGAIGLGTGVYIGADKFPATGAVAHWWNGSSLTPIGQPPLSFFRAIWNSTNLQNENYTLVSARPLCRSGANTALCVGAAITDANGDVAFNDWDGQYWAFYFMRYFAQNSNGFGSTEVSILDAQDDNPGVIIDIDPSRGFEYMSAKILTMEVSFNGSARLLFHAGPGGFSAPYLTGYSGSFDYSWMKEGGFILNSVPPSGFGLVQHWRIFSRISGGPYEVWAINDPDAPVVDGNGFPIDLETYERVRLGAGYRTTPWAGSPYPRQSPSTSVGERITAACPFGNSYFVTSVGQQSGVINGARYGLLGRTRPSPFGLNQGSPRAAGGRLFMNGMISANGGLSWYPHPSSFGFGPGSSSCGSMTVPWTFKLTQAQIDQAAII